VFALLIGGKNDKLRKMSLVFGNGYVTERNKSLQFNDGEVVDRAALDSVGIGLFFWLIRQGCAQDPSFSASQAATLDLVFLGVWDFG